MNFKSQNYQGPESYEGNYYLENKDSDTDTDLQRATSRLLNLSEFSPDFENEKLQQISKD